MKPKALFLDRDGVINIDSGYVYKKENFFFLEGIFEIVSYANQNGYLVIVITNQSGIARGFYSENDFYVISKWMKKEFNKNNCKIDDIFYCPYHSKHGKGKYKKNSILRKPSPGMLIMAKEKYDIDMESSILIGDKITDIQAGELAGVGTLLLYGSSSENYSKDNFIQINELTKAISFI